MNVIRFGLCSRASAAMAVESMPPDRKEPTVTSARMCLATESRMTSAISSYSFSGSSRTGVGRNVWKK